MTDSKKTLKIIIAVLSGLLVLSLLALAGVLIKFYSIPPQTVTDSVSDNIVGEITQEGDAYAPGQ